MTKLAQALAAAAGVKGPSKEWCINAAHREGDVEVSVGPLTAKTKWPSDELIDNLVASATEEDRLTKVGPHPATIPTQAQIEAAARALHKREMERGEHANNVLSVAMQKTITGASTEPFEEHAEMWHRDAEAALTAAAEAEEQIQVLKTVEATTIERCAQRLDEKARATKTNMRVAYEDAAAAVRAMKED